MKLWIPFAATAGSLLAIASFVGADWDLPPVDTEQIGYRGTGMYHSRDREDVEALRAANVVPELLYEADPTGDRAGDIYENVQILDVLSDDQFNLFHGHDHGVGIAGGRLRLLPQRGEPRIRREIHQGGVAAHDPDGAGDKRRLVGARAADGRYLLYLPPRTAGSGELLDGGLQRRRRHRHVRLYGQSEPRDRRDGLDLAAQRRSRKISFGRCRYFASTPTPRCRPERIRPIPRTPSRPGRS